MLSNSAVAVAPSAVPATPSPPPPAARPVCVFFGRAAAIGVPLCFAAALVRRLPLAAEVR